MKTGRSTARAPLAVLLCTALCFASWEAAAEEDDIAEMKRAIKALQEENRALTKRVVTLEAEKAKQAERSEATQRKAETATQPALADGKEQERLEQRVKELEMAKAAQEDAVRSIIQSSVSTLGSKINESVSLGGALQVTGGRSKDFSGVASSKLELSTFEFDFEVQASDWVRGSAVIEYVNGTDAVFPTTSGFQTGVDRINLDTAHVTIGDVQRFPPFLKAGRMILPFGTSTGVLRADVLSIESPLTIEAFEFRNTAVGLGMEFPTPPLAPAVPPVVVPPVKPLVINPMISSLSRRLGYNPPQVRPKPLTPVTFAPARPPYHAGIYLYRGNTFREPDSGLKPRNHFDATAGFRAKGHCGRTYDQLRESKLCPWSLDFDVDYNSSVFDSRFLEAEYRGFLDQIGFVPGVAASVKSTFGPFSLVGEWNGAIKQARFVDHAGKAASIKPAAWQLSFGYQFDWNPWVETIGSQGTFVALGYSQSRDLAGVTRLVNGEPTRVGFVPKKRLLLTAGEWVLDGVKLAVEYSRNWDYSLSEGGTGKAANGSFATLTYTW